jgi:hypothetical protein
MAKRIMDEFEIAATLHEARIGSSQWREIIMTCLKISWVRKNLCDRKKHFDSLEVAMERSSDKNTRERRQYFTKKTGDPPRSHGSSGRTL